MSEKRSRWQVMLEFLKRVLGRKTATPGDPYAYVTAPVRRGPKGRSGAAVAELEEEIDTRYPPRTNVS